MGMTPEGKVKKMIKDRLLAEGYVPAGKEMHNATSWFWMPVQGAIGTIHGIPDFVGCSDGLFWAIEAKAKGEQPTENQKDRMFEICCAGGHVMVVRNEEDMDTFFSIFEAHKHG